MHTRTKNKLIGLGFDSALIKKIAEKHLTVDGLRGMNINALRSIGFTDEEAEIIAKKVNRSSIDPTVIKSIISKSGGICCYCEDGIANTPYQIHHIEEYHISQNHDESNLLLVCPTHHAIIHQNKVGTDRQLEVKRKWEKLWIVAEEFLKSGIVFPFGAIESVDYVTAGSITEIFKYTAPRPSVCLNLVKSELADSAVKKLDAENSLIVTGTSGSGKSTFVIGIAGLYKNKSVYKYSVGGSGSLEACREILQFISKAKDCILIIDDANTKLVGEHIEKILNASTVSVQLIVANTRNNFKGEDNLEEHFLNSTIHIKWSEQKYTVKSSLLDNEYEIIEYLKDKVLGGPSHFPLGFGQLDTTLDYHIDKYFNSSNTIWESLFLLGAGLCKVNDFRLELYDVDRFDIVVLYLSIKQISKFETGCNLEELAGLYGDNTILKSQGIPEKEWLREQLEALCERRYLKNERGRYKTIHRQFASKFIESSYLATEENCSQLLDQIFYDYSNANEIVVLWSWLKYSDTSKYLAKWYNPKTTDWDQIVASACTTNIEVLGVLADLMNQTANNKNNSTVQSAWRNKQSEIANLVNDPKLTNLYHFKEIILTLSNHVAEDIKPLCDLIDKENIVRIIKESRAEDYEYLDGLFNKLWDYHPEWVRELMRKIDHDDFKNILKKIKKGNISDLDCIVSFYRNFVIDYKRSDIRIVADTIVSLLSDCKLADMRFPALQRGLSELHLFDNEVNKILEALDANKLAAELSRSNPRCWKPLLSLRIFIMGNSIEKLSQIIDCIDMDKLVKNVERYYMDSSYEFRILIYFLANATPAKRNEIAEAFAPYVENLFSSGRMWIDKDVMQAYNRLSPKHAIPLAHKYEIDLQQVKEIPKFSKIRKEIKKAEATGEDYTLMTKYIDGINQDI